MGKCPQSGAGKRNVIDSAVQTLRQVLVVTPKLALFWRQGYRTPTC